ncbi:hypothetical protein [Leyella lascolaii]|nr:hypothetical protein [Leyella lascolaii]
MRTSLNDCCPTLPSASFSAVRDTNPCRESISPDTKKKRVHGITPYTRS